MVMKYMTSSAKVEVCLLRKDAGLHASLYLVLGTGAATATVTVQTVSVRVAVSALGKEYTYTNVNKSVCVFMCLGCVQD